MVVNRRRAQSNALSTSSRRRIGDDGRVAAGLRPPAARTASRGSARCRRRRRASPPTRLKSSPGSALAVSRSTSTSRRSTAPTPPTAEPVRRLRVAPPARAVRPGRLPARQRRLPRLHVGLPVPLPGAGRPARRPGAPGARAVPAGRLDAAPRTTTSHEFAANHPDAPARPRLCWSPRASAARSSATGRCVRLVLQAARLAAVHSAALAARLAERYGVEVQAVPMGVADPLAATGGSSAGEVRARHGLQPDDVVHRRVRRPHAREAAAAGASRRSRRLAADRPNLHLLLVGSPAAPLRRRSPMRSGWASPGGCTSPGSSPTPTCRRTCRPPTSARACAGPPTARPRPRGCGCSPPGGRR